MKRQGLVTNPLELRQIADELEEEYSENKHLSIPLSQKAILPIINKSKNNESDTWEFE